MRLLNLALAGAMAAACLSACGSGPAALAAAAPITTNLPAVATAPARATSLDEQGWIAATNAWGAAVYAWNKAKPSLPADNVALGRKVVAEGRAVRLAGDAALDAANAPNLGVQIDALGRVVARLNDLRK